MRSFSGMGGAFGKGSKRMEIYLGVHWHSISEELLGVSLPILLLQILWVNVTTALWLGLMCAALILVVVGLEKSWRRRARANSDARWEAPS